MNIKTKNLILGYLVVIIASSIPAIILSKYVEAIIFIICHTLIRPQEDREYHNIIPKICRLITSIVFFFGIFFVLPIGLSLFSAIPISYFIGWVGNVKATSDYYENKSFKFENKLNELKDKYCNEKEDLLLKCRKAKLSERDTNFALMYFYEGKTPKEIWEWNCEKYKFNAVDWQTVYQTLWRIKKKLNIE